MYLDAKFAIKLKGEQSWMFFNLYSALSMIIYISATSATDLTCKPSIRGSDDLQKENAH